LPDDDFGIDVREAELSVKPRAILLTKEERKWRTQLSRLPERDLHDLAPEPAPAVLRVDDHTPQSHNREPLAVDLDLNEHDSGAGHELSRVVSKADVSVFRLEMHGDAGGIERVLLVPFELAPERICQWSELDDLHASMQPKRDVHSAGGARHQP
jgi:hypothetical protein